MIKHCDPMKAVTQIMSRISKFSGSLTSATRGAEIDAILASILQMPMAVEVKIVGYSSMMPRYETTNARLRPNLKIRSIIGTMMAFWLKIIKKIIPSIAIDSA